MAYVLIEAFYFIVWPAIVIARLRSRSLDATEDLLVLMLVLPFAAVAEAINVHRYASTGVYYPRSLLYFPGLEFPVGILFSSSLYVWSLHAVSRWVASRAAPGHMALGNILYFAIFLVVLSSFVVPEDLGVRLGYWNWRVPLPRTPQVWFAKYVFYFWFAFPAVLMARFFAWRVNKNHSQALGNAASIST